MGGTGCASVPGSTRDTSPRTQGPPPMGHTTPEHLEHAEHAQHHAHDPFARGVAVSMAIIAALLAVVTLLSHRGHTETVRLQAEANSIQTEGAHLETMSNVKHTEWADHYAWYQAKKI